MYVDKQKEREATGSWVKFLAALTQIAFIPIVAFPLYRKGGDSAVQL